MAWDTNPPVRVTGLDKVLYKMDFITGTEKKVVRAHSPAGQ